MEFPVRQFRNQRNRTVAHISTVFGWNKRVSRDSLAGLACCRVGARTSIVLEVPHWGTQLSDIYIYTPIVVACDIPMSPKGALLRSQVLLVPSLTSSCPNWFLWNLIFVASIGSIPDLLRKVLILWWFLMAENGQVPVVGLPCSTL